MADSPLRLCIRCKGNKSKANFLIDLRLLTDTVRGYALFPHAVRCGDLEVGRFCNKRSSDIVLM